MNREEFLLEFWGKNKEELKDNYPGLSFVRLKREFEDQFFLNSWKEAYLPGANPKLESFIEQLKQGAPLEYISREAYFYRSAFYVDERVLIPRSETEILVELAQRWAKKRKLQSAQILDLGAGSGIIGLSLAAELKLPGRLVLSDISSDALEICKINYERMKFQFDPELEVEFILSDRFDRIKGQFDLLCSNPPYIKKQEGLKGVHHQVLNHEPALALFLEDDSYDEWFEILFKGVESHLKRPGYFIMEGHEDELEKLSLKFKEYSFSLELDLTQRARFLTRQK